MHQLYVFAFSYDISKCISYFVDFYFSFFERWRTGENDEGDTINDKPKW